MGLAARMRDIEVVYFPDLYDSLADMAADGKMAPKRDLITLIANVETKEHAVRVYNLLMRDFANKLALGADDYSVRKKLYIQLSVIACQIGVPEVALRFVESLDRLRLQTYYGADAIEILGGRGVSLDILCDMLEIARRKRGASNKGVRSMYHELIITCLKRRMFTRMLELSQQADADGMEFGPALTKFLEKVRSRQGTEPIPAAAS